MKLLFKNANVVNVFTDDIELTNVFIENEKITGVGKFYTDTDADEVVDCKGKYMCPGFIDGHIHIESTKLTPPQFCKIAIPHGTLAVVADPHEIANVCGTDGIDYMIQSSEGLPMDIYFMVPSCVPATKFDESGSNLDPQSISKYYGNKRIVGLAEMMDYPGVINDDPQVKQKLTDAKDANVYVSGHAPLLKDKDLCKYIASGICDDHECSNIKEAIEKIKLGQHVMIRYGSSEKNLPDLMQLFNEKYNRMCSLVTDDKDEGEIIHLGHIDAAIREAIKLGADPVVAIRMATIQIARHYGLIDIGAIAPGYYANIVLFDDLRNINIEDVYYRGNHVACGGKCFDFEKPKVDQYLVDKVFHSVNIKEIKPADFHINHTGIHKCNVIGFIPKQVITNKEELDINFDINNGVDAQKDIVKVALIERHKASGNIGLGYVLGTHLTQGAVASSIGHDSHNIIVLGANDVDMSIAVNEIAKIQGGNVVVHNGEILGEFSLPIAGLMSDIDPIRLLDSRSDVIEKSRTLCNILPADPLLATAFLSLPVIPSLKITTHGLFDVNKFDLCDLVID